MGANKRKSPASKTTMGEETGTQFRVEGEPAFATESTEKDNSASSSEGEKTNSDTTQSDGGDNSQTESKDTDKGFADHPRWKERESDWTRRFNDQETRHVSELQKLREEVDTKLATVSERKTEAADDAPVTVPSWFGGDEQQWKEFQKWNNSLLSDAEKRGAEKAMKGIEEKTAAEQKKIEDATNYFNEQVSNIESDKDVNPKGVKIDRNKLLKFTLDNDLVDSKGRWNYKAAFRLMTGTVEQKSNESTQERKNLASATMSDGKAEAKPEPYTTSADFEKQGSRPW